MTGTRLEIDLLGPLQVRVDGDTVAVPGPRRRAVLALLAVASPDTVSADALFDAVWGDEPPETARNSLQSQISRLRGHLGPCSDRLERRGAGYRLHLDDGERDLDRVRSLHADARRSADDDQRAAELLREAIATWRGEALDEFADIAPLAAQAVGLGELRATLVDERSELLLASGDVDAAVEQAVRAAAEAPLRERSQLVAMRALATAGRAPDALRHGAAFRSRMVDETGLDPSPALAELEQSIAAGDTAAPAAPRSSPAARAVLATAAPALPGRALRLVGREREQEDLARFVATDRLVTLVGPGGVGKSRLAIELAWEDERTAGFVALAELEDTGAIIPALASSLGLRTESGDGLPEACISRLSAGPTLLVIDNCEHVLAGARNVITDLLARCPELTVLATSREPLDLPEERRMPLGPLPVPPADAPLDPDRWPSVELFAARAERVAPEFRLDHATWEGIAEICRELDGLPLALELAAGRVATLGVDGLRKRMSRMLDVVVGGRGRTGSAERHADLDNLVRWSYDMLGPHEARLFRHLSVFVGGFDLDGAEQIGGSLAVPAPAGAVARLVETSLVNVTHGDPPRYAMLNTIRAFGESELERHGESAEAAALLIGWATELAGEANRAFSTAAQVPAILRVRAEIANLRAARRIAIAQGDIGALAIMISQLRQVIGWAHQRELFGWARELAEDPALVGQPERPAVLATAGFVAWRQGDLGAARLLAQEGLTIAEDPEHRVACMDALAAVELLEGNPAEAVELWLKPSTGHPVPPELRSSAAVALGYLGRVDEAIAMARQALADSERMGAPINLSFCLYALGELLMEIDEVEAEAVLRRGVELDPPSVAGFSGGVSLLTLVTLWQRRGDHRLALEGYRDLVLRWWQSGSWTQEWTTLRNLARLLAELGDHPTALLLLTAAAQASNAPAVAPAEAERLGRLSSELETELGPVTVEEPAAAVQDALASIDRLLAG